MHITLLAIGSQGDVQPYVALGLGLEDAGHQVRIAAYSNFENFVASRGLRFLPLFGDYQEVIKQVFSGELGRDLTSQTRNPVRLARALRGLNAIMNPVREQTLRDSWKAIQDTDFVIHNRVSYACYGHDGSTLPPMCEASVFPLWLTGEFPSYICPWLPNLSPLLNRVSHLVADQLLWQSARGVVNRWRTVERRIAPIPFSGFHRELHREQRLQLYGFSPALVPKPRDWPSWLHVTGFWFLDSQPDWSPPEDLLRFLAAGPPPITVGFSSAGTPPEVVSRTVIEAVRKTGRRAVLLTGWAGLGGLKPPDSVYVAEFIPHTWLLPRSSANINHGGPGTLAVALRAGVPSIIVPAAVDQPFWAKRLELLGASPPAISPKNLTSEALVEAIHRVHSDRTIRSRTEEIGRQIATERGVDNAIAVLEAHFRKLPSRNRSLCVVAP